NDAVVDDLGTDILHWLDDVDAPLATLRSGSLELVITGQAYANGVIATYTFETVTISAGEEVPFIVDTTPNDADTNMDGAVTVVDWVQFKSGQNAEMSALTLLQSFQLGDIDHDLDNDIDDFIAFKFAYEEIHGVGSFAALLSVPEPSTLVLFALASSAALGRRRRQSQCR
ncbi:MAG: PEP-CTERM sorting domain-containing protein, partial [Pirellulales bacterium]|nr:PEP-CTERM sorting domain-containing protein [Pirellulales bacterium]